MSEIANSFKRKTVTLVKFFQKQGLHTFYTWFIAYAIPRNIGIPFLISSEIVPYVYVGPQYNKLGQILLYLSRFTSSVNMREDFDDAEHNLAMPHYCYLPIDCYNPQILEACVNQLFIGVDFIKKAVEKREKTYVHCNFGVHRSVVLTIAYILSLGYSISEAHDILFCKRPDLVTFYEPWMMSIIQLYEKEMIKKKPEHKNNLGVENPGATTQPLDSGLFSED